VLDLDAHRADVELRLATPQAACGTDALSNSASVRSSLTR
jgi:hypothetical protein